jgi:YHS domain-containing protein
MAIDPVCKMQVETAKARATTKYKGKTYYFCAESCKKSFEQDLEAYLSH